MNQHNDPRLLEMGRRESPSRSKDTASLLYRQVIGREVRIVHHRESLDQAGPRNVWMREAGPCVLSSKRRVNVSIGDSRGRTLSVRTGQALGVHPLGCSPPAFHLMPGAHRRWLHPQLESGGEAPGWTIAWGAWWCRRRWTAVCNATVLEWGRQ